MSDDATEQQSDTTDEGQRDAGLGADGEKALKSERARANKAEKDYKALQAQFESVVSQTKALKETNDAFQSRFDSTVAEKDLTISKYRIGVTKGLPEALINRLQGADEAAIEADADELMKLIPAAPTNHNPRPDPSQGAKAPGNTSLESQFAAAFGPLLNP